MPSQSLANHRSESSGKDSTVTQSPGRTPPSPPPQPTSGRSHNLRAAPLPFSPSSQEHSRGPFGQQAGRRDSHSTCKWLGLPWTTSFLTQPISSTRSSKVSHRLSVTPKPAPNLLPNPLEGWETQLSSLPAATTSSPAASSLQAGRFGSAHWEAWRRDSIHGMVWSNSGTVPQLSPSFLELGKDPCPKPGTQQHPGLAQEEEEEEERRNTHFCPFPFTQPHTNCTARTQQ